MLHVNCLHIRSTRFISRASIKNRGHSICLDSSKINKAVTIKLNWLSWIINSTFENCSNFSFVKPDSRQFPNHVFVQQQWIPDDVQCKRWLMFVTFRVLFQKREKCITSEHKASAIPGSLSTPKIVPCTLKQNVFKTGSFWATGLGWVPGPKSLRALALQMMYMPGGGGQLRTFEHVFVLNGTFVPSASEEKPQRPTMSSKVFLRGPLSQSSKGSAVLVTNQVRQWKRNQLQL